MYMKKLLFAAALLCGVIANAQEYKVEGTSVVFTKVIENTGKTVAEAHSALEAFFALRYNDVNSTQKLNQEDHLIYKGIFGTVHTFPLGWVIDMPHTVDVSIKENRLRVKVTIDEGACRSTANANRYTYPVYDYSPIGTHNKNLLKKDAIRAFEVTCDRINALFADIENSLKNTATEEDW